MRDRSHLLEKQTHGMEKWCRAAEDSMALGSLVLVILLTFYLPWVALPLMVVGFIWAWFTE